MLWLAMSGRLRRRETAAGADECPDIDGYNAGCDTADDNSFDLFGNILVHVGASLKSFYALSIDASCEIVNTGKKS